MNEDIKRELNREGEQSKLHCALLDHTKKLVKISRGSMSKHYDTWDLQDEVYRGLRTLDNDDVKQTKQGKPTKMIVPNTFAQCMTFTSFLFLMFNQNRNFFELTPTGREDYGQKKDDMESVLAKQLRENKMNTLMFQHLLDVSRFGPAIFECNWTRKISNIFVPGEQKVTNVNGVEVESTADGWREIVRYEGNELRNVSPYRFFPDTRLPLVDFQKGEFCAAEEEYSMARLRQLEQADEVAGIDRIEKFGANGLEARGGATRSPLIVDDAWRKFDSSSNTCNALVTKVQCWIIPKKFKYDGDDKTLGTEEFPVLYHIWYANDNRVIRCEPARWWHNQFGWTLSQFTPDMHQTLTTGLADLIYRLQDVISWNLNSHITSVRRIIQNRFLINPAAIDTKTLDGEGDIYMRKGMNVPLERAMTQLKVQDVTGGHMNDVATLGQIMEMVTGVNGNAMGQYNSGRRSAQEARVVTAGAAGRMKMHGHLIWDGGFGPLGTMMLSNSRQSLSLESFVRTIGTSPQQLPPEQRFAIFQGTPEDVISGDDYFTFDSTLASEKGFIAQSLQELLGIILSNPAASQQLDLSPKAMLEEIQSLRGAGPISRFSLAERIASGQEQPQPMAVPPPTL